MAKISPNFLDISKLFIIDINVGDCEVVLGIKGENFVSGGAQWPWQDWAFDVVKLLGVVRVYLEERGIKETTVAHRRVTGTLSYSKTTTTLSQLLTW